MLLVYVRVMIGCPIILRVLVYLCTATCIDCTEINVKETETFMTWAKDYLVNPFVKGQWFILSSMDRKVM